MLFRFALPARGASRARYKCAVLPLLCLGAACTGCISSIHLDELITSSLPRRCLHGVHRWMLRGTERPGALPRRCLHGVHPSTTAYAAVDGTFASALPARGASLWRNDTDSVVILCLGAACTGCIGRMGLSPLAVMHFASALPARGASVLDALTAQRIEAFASALPARGASAAVCGLMTDGTPLPRRCLHGVHRNLTRFPPASMRSLPRRCLHGVHLFDLR